MDDFLNLKIDERSNVEQLSLRDTKIENIKIEKIYLYQRENMRIGKTASSAEYRNDDQFQKS